MNLIIHKYKPFKKWTAYITIGFFTYIKYDTVDMLDKAAKKLDYFMYTKPMKDELSKRSLTGTSKKGTWKEV